MRHLKHNLYMSVFFLYVLLVEYCADNVYKKFFFSHSKCQARSRIRPFHILLLLRLLLLLPRGHEGAESAYLHMHLCTGQGWQLIIGHVQESICNYTTMCANTILY